MRAFGLLLLFAALFLPLFSPSPASAQQIWIEGGGQVGFESYNDAFELAGGYATPLQGSMHLDLGASVLVKKHSDIALQGGLRWLLGSSVSGVVPFIRTDLEIALLVRSKETRFAIAPKVGGGAGFYPAGSAWGVVLEVDFAIGPAFGGGVHLAAALDLMAGGIYRF